MKSTILIVATFVALTLLVSACAPAATPSAQPPATQAPAATASGNGYGGNSYGNSPAATATTGAASSATGPATVNVGNSSKYSSPFLVDAKGMTLYIFLNDTSTTSTCTGTCANNWPAVLTNGAPVAGTGVDGTKLGTTTRADGTTQVTYNGHPLYYFVQDKAAGDTNGQGIKSVWYVVSSAGDAIKQ